MIKCDMLLSAYTKFHTEPTNFCHECKLANVTCRGLTHNIIDITTSMHIIGAVLPVVPTFEFSPLTFGLSFKLMLSSLLFQLLHLVRSLLLLLLDFVCEQLEYTKRHCETSILKIINFVVLSHVTAINFGTCDSTLSPDVILTCSIRKKDV